jgi:hypothetical protein
MFLTALICLIGFTTIALLKGPKYPDASLNGALFCSVKKYMMGPRAVGYASLRFQEDSFEWWYSDWGDGGNYRYDSTTGKISVSHTRSGTFDGRYDKNTGMMTWEGETYRFTAHRWFQAHWCYD